MDNYTGRYAHVDAKVVLNFLMTVLPKDNFELLLEEYNTTRDQVHMRCMKQMYEMYEKYNVEELERGTILYRSVAE